MYDTSRYFSKNTIALLVGAVFLLLFVRLAYAAGTQTFSTPGSFQFTVPAYNTMTVSVWGGGGTGSGLDSVSGTYVSGGTGQASSFNGTVIANGGVGGTNPGGGAGGSASGGDANTSGTAGGTGIIGCSGAGGGSPNGGAGGAAVCPSSGLSSEGNPGGSPGAGGSGYILCVKGCTGAGVGGGGGGGYATKTYASGAIAVGTNVAVVVGSGGNTSTQSVGSRGGLGASGRVTVTWTDPVLLPGIPGTPTFSSVTPSSMRVNWTAASNATSYKIERCAGVGCSTFTQIAAGITTLFYDDSGLTQGTSYSYRVRATNADGDGAYSGTGTQATQLQPPTCTLTPASQNITNGSSATLNYTITGSATSATINGVAVPTTASGVYNPSPAVTTAYNMSVTGPGGTTGCGPSTVIVSPATPRCVIPSGSNTPLTGYAWSETIGWVDLNCSNQGTCGTSNFGMTVTATGTIAGCGWSENIGWITASQNDLTGCPSGTCNALIGNSGKVTGWLKALAADGIGWDGWVSLSGTSPVYGVTLGSGTSTSGYAWGSTNVGWVDFSKAATAYTPCYSQNICSATSTQNVVDSCAPTIVTQVCTSPQQCSAGACVILPPSFTSFASGAQSGHLQATPKIVNVGATTQVFWQVANVTSCTVVSTNGDSWTAVFSGTNGTTSKPIIALTTFNLTCNGPGGTVNEKVSVSLAPAFQER